MSPSQGPGKGHGKGGPGTGERGMPGEPVHCAYNKMSMSYQCTSAHRYIGTGRVSASGLANLPT